MGKAYTGRSIKQIPESVAAWKFVRSVPRLDSARQPDSRVLRGQVLCWLVLQVRANWAVAESLNVTASLVLTRVPRAPIGGLSNVAHPGKISSLARSPIARMIGGGIVS